MNKYTFLPFSVFALIVLASTNSHAQRYPSPPPPPYSSVELERRMDYLEQTVRDLNYRLQRLEYGSVNPSPREYYCIAKCVGSSSSAGGRGRSESEAKQAAFDALRQKVTCTMDITECSQEN